MADYPYPQSEKLREVEDERRAIVGFVEWLGMDRGIELCEFNEEAGDYYGIVDTIDSLVMRYLEIDERALEQERRAMLASLRGES